MAVRDVRVGGEFKVGPWKGRVARVHDAGTVAFDYVDKLGRKIRDDARWNEDEEAWEFVHKGPSGAYA